MLTNLYRPVRVGQHVSALLGVGRDVLPPGNQECHPNPVDLGDLVVADDNAPRQKTGLPDIPFGHAAQPKISLGGANAGFQIARQIYKAVSGAKHERELREARQEQQRDMSEVVANVPPIHGSAHWASRDELRAAPKLQITQNVYQSPSSLLLGALMDDGARSPSGYLEWDGEGHLITVAPTRTGKSTMQIIPNLLRYKGSAVVLDPKGELYEVTSKWRRTIGEVYRVAPFEEVSDCFNPLDEINRTSDARTLADLILPPDPHSSSFFRNDGINFLTGLFEFVKSSSPAGQRSMSEVRRITAAKRDEFVLFVSWMQDSPHEAVRHAANIVLDKNAEKGLPNLRDTLSTELAIWDDPEVKRVSGRSDFSFKSLKDRPVTVYITVPFDTMASYAGYLKVILTTALSAMTENRTIPKIPVLFVLDEFLSLGRFDKFKDAIRTHAGAGVRFWFFLQNVATLEELYPRASGAFWDAAVKLFFGTSNMETAQMVSELLDYTTVPQKTTTYSMGTSVSREDFFDVSRSQTLNVSQSVQLHRRLLMTPGEVINRLDTVLPDRTRHGIAKIGGAPPTQLRLIPYFIGEEAPRRIGKLK